MMHDRIRNRTYQQPLPSAVAVRTDDYKVRLPFIGGLDDPAFRRAEQYLGCNVDLLIPADGAEAGQGVIEDLFRILLCGFQFRSIGQVTAVISTARVYPRRSR
jgi:hypothetical protein